MLLFLSYQNITRLGNPYLIFKVYKPWGVVTFLAQVLQVTKFISLFPVNSRNL
jgi:hypothetical protein